MLFFWQLEKAREATDAANIRAAYAEVVANSVSGETDTDKLTKEVTLTQTKSGWANSFEFPKNLTETTDAKVPAANNTAGDKVTITATETGASCSIKLK